MHNGNFRICDKGVTNVKGKLGGKGRVGSSVYLYQKAGLAFCSTFHLDTGTLANSEDPDEMPHEAALHEVLHCLLLR